MHGSPLSVSSVRLGQSFQAATKLLSDSLGQEQDDLVPKLQQSANIHGMKKTLRMSALILWLPLSHGTRCLSPVSSTTAPARSAPLCPAAPLLFLLPQKPGSALSRLRNWSARRHNGSNRAGRVPELLQWKLWKA